MASVRKDDRRQLKSTSTLTIDVRLISSSPSDLAASKFSSSLAALKNAKIDVKAVSKALLTTEIELTLKSLAELAKVSNSGTLTTALVKAGVKGVVVTSLRRLARGRVVAMKHKHGAQLCF